MKITGMVAWGNGEPCPFCGEMVPDEQHMEHLFQEHKKEMNEKLFAEAEG